MGVDAIVIVENKRHITLDDFVDGMRVDQWGKYYALDYHKEAKWDVFYLEGENYFSLIHDRPRYARLYKEEFDFENNKYYPNPRFSFVAQVRFCKAMEVANKLAGGPVYLGNDVMNLMKPDQASGKEVFVLPFELDCIIDDWHAIAALPITPDSLESAE